MDQIEKRLSDLEQKVKLFVDGMDRGIGTAIIETEKAKSGEDANIAAVRGLKAIRAQIKKIKALD